MATLAFTFTVPADAGAQIRQLASTIEKASAALGDRNGSGASVTLTLDNAPSTGVASVLIAGGGLPTQPTFLT